MENIPKEHQPSVKPSPPRKPPVVNDPGKPESGQAGVKYGAGHTLRIKDSAKTEFPC